MTFRFPFIYLFSFLFFFLFVTNAHAYQIFNTNPFYDSNISGSYLTYNNNLNAYYNSTCSGQTGCLILANNGTDTINRLFITNSSSASTYFTSDWTNLTGFYNYLTSTIGTQQYLDVPKGKEGIIAIKYYWNDTPQPTPQILVINRNTGVGQSIPLSITNQTWLTTTYIINASSSYDFTPYTIYLYYELGNVSEYLAIDKFQFYTMDINEIRNDWTNNTAYEINKYCNTTNITYYELFSNTSFIFGIDTNGIYCGLVRLDNLIIARHWTYYLQDAYYCNLLDAFYTPNLILLRAYTGDYDFIGFFEQFLRTQIKMTILRRGDSNYSVYSIRYDDVYDTTMQLNSLKNNYSTAWRQYIDLVNNTNIDISNQNPSGNNFRLFGDIGACQATIPYHPFFSSNIQVDNTGWYCSDITNAEGYILGNGTEINHLYCGDFGCNAEHTHCNFGFIGIYCSDSTHWIYSDVNGIQDTGSCLYGCYNKTYGIDCYLNNNVTPECFNNNGQLIDCHVLKKNATDETINNCLSSGDYFCVIALSLTSLIGVTDKSLSESFLSILITFLISISVLFLGRKSNVGMEGFLVTIAVFICTFALLGLLNPIVFVLIIILDAYMLYNMILGSKK